MDFNKTTNKLRDYFAITQTAQLMEKLDFRKKKHKQHQSVCKRRKTLIRHQAYPNGNPVLLEEIFINYFNSGIWDRQSRKRVIIKKSKTLTEATLYARFAEAAERVEKNRSHTQASVCAVASSGRSSGFS